jgi:DNA topoisomerase I
VLKESKKGTSRAIEIVSLAKGKITETTNNEIAGTEKNKLFPTDLGIIVTEFLRENFANILDFQFTAQVEKQFDEIAEGKVQWTSMIGDFYSDFHPQVEKSSKESKKFVGERLLGTDPKTKKNVYVKVGRYGPIVQIGETGDDEKPKFASLLKHQSVHEITLDEALELFTFPISLGEHEKSEVIVSVGPYGPYVKHEGKFYQIPATQNPLKVTLADAIIIMNNKMQNAGGVINDFNGDPDMSIRKGKWGPYIKLKNDNYKIPKNYDPSELTKEECMEIIEQAKLNPPKKRNFKRKK